MATVYSFANESFAAIVGRSEAMDGIAADIAAAMRAVALNASVGPEFIDGIQVVKAARGKDRIVGTSDPLAVPKELGHVIRNEADGPVLGYVRGAHVVSKTIVRLHSV